MDLNKKILFYYFEGTTQQIGSILTQDTEPNSNIIVAPISWITLDISVNFHFSTQYNDITRPIFHAELVGSEKPDISKNAL